MFPLRYASPLYILREACARDLFGVLERLSTLGFDGVEFLGFFGRTADAVRDKLDALGLAPLGNHVPYAALLHDTAGVLEFHQTVGCRYLTVSELPTEDLTGLAMVLDTVAAEARARDITLLTHNHAQELREQVGGQALLRCLLETVSSDTLRFEPDLGWIEIGGGDCAAYLTDYRDRCPVIHLKDYYASDLSLIGNAQEFLPDRGKADRGYFEFRPVGYGVLNLPRLLPLCLACGPEWLVMDHDLSYERDPFEDLRLSLDYTKRLVELQAQPLLPF